MNTIKLNLINNYYFTSFIFQQSFFTNNLTFIYSKTVFSRTPSSFRLSTWRSGRPWSSPGGVGEGMPPEARQGFPSLSFTTTTHITVNQQSVPESLNAKGFTHDSKHDWNKANTYIEHLNTNVQLLPNMVFRHLEK